MACVTPCFQALVSSFPYFRGDPKFSRFLALGFSEQRNACSTVLQDLR